MSPASRKTQPKNGPQTCSPCHFLLAGYHPFLYDQTIARSTLRTNAENDRNTKALSPFMDNMVIFALRMRKHFMVAHPHPPHQASFSGKGCHRAVAAGQALGLWSHHWSSSRNGFGMCDAFIILSLCSPLVI